MLTPIAGFCGQTFGGLMELMSQGDTSRRLGWSCMGIWGRVSRESCNGVNKDTRSE